DSSRYHYQLLVTDLPDSILLHIFQYLPFSAICQVSQVCHRWHQVCSDDLLWRSVFLWHYKLPFTTSLHRKAKSWRSEFKRMYYHTPSALVDEFKEHKDEVLHVSFSHDGSMFATCSKDGYFMIWSTQRKPVGLLFKMDMKSRFNWQFTQFSQFNASDTRLLVSGVYSGPFTTSGEIAIFDLQDNFEIESRVTNKPYDVFGAWFDNEHLLSGTIYSTGNLSSVSAIWISKASQEVESEVESVSMVLYRFQNINSSTVRLINVADIEKASAVTEDSDRPDETGETRACPCSSDCQDPSEPTLLDKLLCREISEEEFDVDNEDWDNHSDDAKCDRKEEECSGSDTEEKDMLTLAENSVASGSMEWSAEEGNSALEYLKTAGGAANIKSGQECDSLCLDCTKACCVNVCDLNTRDSNPGDYADTCQARTADSSNNASFLISGNVSASNNCVINKGLNTSASKLTESRDQCSSSHVFTYTSHVHSQSGSGDFSLDSASQNPGKCAVLLTNHQEVGTCVGTNELTHQDLQGGCRGDQGESSDSGFQCGGRNKHSDIDSADGSSANSLFGITGALKLSPRDFRLENSTKNWSKTKLKMGDGTDTEYDECGSLTSMSECSRLHSSGHRTDTHIDPCQQRPSLSVPHIPTDNSDHLSNPGVTHCKLLAKCQKTSSGTASLLPQPSLPNKAVSGPNSSGNLHKSCPSTRQTATKRSQSCQASPSLSDDGRLRQCRRPPEKLLIYTWGTKTFTPHKIGIKRMKWEDFSKGEVKARRVSMLPRVMDNLQNGAEPTRRDEPDHSIEMHGHIVGLRVAPDQRYLYVNCRPWPKNYIISDPQESPPLAQEVEISTIDLQTLQFVGPVLRSHKAFTHSDDCFFLNLDVAEDFVVSGAEDKQGYLWDRHYGVPLYRFPHSNVVNCVAVNPRDPEMLVTVSDDHSIKVWASRHRKKHLQELNISQSDDGIEV
ncbi:hypothetical protein EGW08_005048, partial [Elysia chlorotica]